jgi:hypothetical protein
MISIRKPTQHIVNALGWLPELDWTKSWTTKDIYDEFKLTDDEIKLIESEMAYTMRRHAKYLSHESGQSGAKNLQCTWDSGKRDGKLTFRPVRPDEITKNQNLIGKHKVITAKAFGHTNGSNGTANIFILKPNEVCTETYLVLAAFDSQEEAENFKGFMHTAFAQYIISVHKPTQDIVGALKWLPELDWTKPWTAQDIYDEFKLTDDEIKLIESEMAHAMRRHAKYLSQV